MVPGATGGVTGGGEIRGAEAAEPAESADGEEVVFAAGVPTGPTWAHAARITHSPAAKEIRTGE
ncbi:MAG: hypothetical protein AUH82_01715 [Chloroflexi bacterium 13_1_40CM_4_65_13]|nr:MAG: hypothetical protein AUH82_01715 [Chloroflexi bacterium 13_1_40CM_4_65_13]